MNLLIQKNIYHARDIKHDKIGSTRAQAMLVTKRLCFLLYYKHTFNNYNNPREAIKLFVYPGEVI